MAGYSGQGEKPENQPFPVFLTQFYQRFTNISGELDLFFRAAMGSQYAVYPLNRVPDLVAPASNDADDEPGPDLDEEVQED